MKTKFERFSMSIRGLALLISVVTTEILPAICTNLQIRNLFALLTIPALPALARAQFTYMTNNITLTITGCTGAGKVSAVNASDATPGDQRFYRLERNPALCEPENRFNPCPSLK